MPEFRVISVREVFIFKYARYERQDLLNNKEFSVYSGLIAQNFR
jgi:hypothetical protein